MLVLERRGTQQFHPYFSGFFGTILESSRILILLLLLISYLLGIGYRERERRKGSAEGGEERPITGKEAGIKKAKFLPYRGLFPRGGTDGYVATTCREQALV
jgi:hypothetical protein